MSTSRRSFSLPVIAVTAFALCAVFAALAPSHARAAEKENYTLTSIPSCNSGEYDEQGNLYIGCGGYIDVYSPNRTLITRYRASADDVGPSPDGSYIYYISGYKVHRIDRQANGSYKADSAWTLANFPYGDAMRAPLASRLAVDGFGNIYIADGYWTSGSPLNVCVKFNANGQFVTTFGEYTDGDATVTNNKGWQTDPRLWEMGAFYWGVDGIDVSRDGREVYTTEIGNDRVQRWEWQGDGSYKSVEAFGSDNVNVPGVADGVTDPARVGSCANGNMAAPYDVGVDPWGYVYVMNTTCTQVQKFTWDGQFVYSSFVGNRGQGEQGWNGGTNQRSHYLAVDGNGNAWSGQTQELLNRPTSSTPGAWPKITEPTADLTAPVLKSVAIPKTTTSSTIPVTIDATDNVGVTQVRFASENGDDWTAWQPFQATMQYTLLPGYGYHGVVVQVQDAAGNVSSTIYQMTTVENPAGGGAPVNNGGDDATAPVLNSVSIPATTTTSTITVTLDATDNVGVTQVRFASENGDDWTNWMPYKTTMQYTLLPGNGYHGVSVQVADAAGNTSKMVYEMTNVEADGAGGGAPVNNGGDDATAPVLKAVSIPQPTTKTATIPVSITATDNVGVTQVRFASENGDDWTAWQPFQATMQYTLLPGNGYHGVVVQVADAAGNASNTIYEMTDVEPNGAGAGAPPANGGDNDATAPVLNSVSIPATTTTSTITVTLDATDNVGVTQVRFASENGDDWTNWMPYKAAMQYTLLPGNGYHGVSVQVADAAGNTSKMVYEMTDVEPAA